MEEERKMAATSRTQRRVRWNRWLQVSIKLSMGELQSSLHYTLNRESLMGMSPFIVRLPLILLIIFTFRMLNDRLRCLRCSLSHGYRRSSLPRHLLFSPCCCPAPFLFSGIVLLLVGSITTVYTGAVFVGLGGLLIIGLAVYHKFFANRWTVHANRRVVSGRRGSFLTSFSSFRLFSSPPFLLLFFAVVNECSKLVNWLFYVSRSTEMRQKCYCYIEYLLRNNWVHRLPPSFLIPLLSSPFKCLHHWIGISAFNSSLNSGRTYVPSVFFLALATTASSGQWEVVCPFLNALSLLPWIACVRRSRGVMQTYATRRRGGKMVLFLGRGR